MCFMRIVGFLLFAVGFAWFAINNLAVALPKAGNYSYRLKSLPVQETYTRQQFRNVAWEICAFRWSFPEEEFYTRQQVTNIIRAASVDSPRKRDVSVPPPVVIPVVLLVVGAFFFGAGIGKGPALRSDTPNGGLRASLDKADAIGVPPSVN